MQRILRDTWAWRGGLMPDELMYEPRLADARAGPITEPAWRHWPVLVSQLEVTNAIELATGLGVREVLGPVAVHIGLSTRTGGYHAILPDRLPQLEREYMAIRGGEDAVPGYDESLELLERAGVIERANGCLALLRPRPPSNEQLHEAKLRLDRHDVNVPVESMTQRVLDLECNRVSAGLGAQRYRELARFRRLHASIRVCVTGTLVTSGVFKVGPMALPPVPGRVASDAEDLHAARGWIGLPDIELDHGDEDGMPLLTGGHEAAALLLGEGMGANATRRAVRGAILWLTLCDYTGGTVGTVRVPMAALTRRVAGLLGLDACADHRSRVRMLLNDLMRTGMIKRLAADCFSIQLVRPPSPDDDAIRHFLSEWIIWHERHRDEPTRAALRLAEEHLRSRVRGTWVRLLEERRITIEVRPPSVPRSLARPR